MGDFEKWILSISEVLHRIIVVAVTLTFALWGGSLGAISGAMSGNTRGSELVGTLIGGGIGFLMSVLFVSLAVSLSEIAKNTRRTVELLERPNHKEEAEERPIPYAHATKEVSREAQTVLQKAKEQGFTMEISDNNTAIKLSKKDWGSQSFRSNNDLQKFGRQMGWTA